MKQPANYIHLDLKGMIPDEAGVIDWIDRLAEAGFTGIVFEYEDRLPWRTWPGAFRAGYSTDAWRRIWQRCRLRGLDVLPLIQTQGHLGWLLRHEAYAHLRENDEVSEACPLHPEFRPRVLKWIDEVIELHPDATIIHLGADETFCMGSCRACRAKAATGGDALSIYIEHITALARHVLDRGRRPMIWGDMFWPDNRRAAALPRDLILVDWQYGFLGPTEVTIKDVPQQVWAASAARSSDSFDLRYLLGPLGQRLRNVKIWKDQLARGAVAGLIHTVWSRSGSHGVLYGPVEGWWPVIEYAADAARLEAHPLRSLMSKVDAAMHPRPGEVFEAEFSPDLSPFKQHADVMVRRTAAWWELAIRHADLTRRAEALGAQGALGAPSVARFGSDAVLGRRLAAARSRLADDLAGARHDAERLLNEWAASDADEFLAARFDRLTNLAVRSLNE